MTTFGDLDPAAVGDDDDTSDDEEYLPENDSDAAGSNDDEDGDDPAASDSDASGDQPRRRSTNRKTAGGRKSKVKGQPGKLPDLPGRARRGGIRFDGPEEAAAMEPATAKGESPEAPMAKASPTQVVDDARAKERADALWSSFLSDVGRPKPVPAAAGPATSAAAPPPPPPAEKRPAVVAKTTTKVFDFAGETVRVEVPAAPASSSSSSSSGAASTGGKRPSAVSGGVRGLLDSLSKRPKLSTLEKSRLDWETFKSAEGISEDLAAHNRGKAGFLERQAFLERADYRQFERERDARLASSKKPS